MTGGHRHSRDRQILAGDVVVSHVNGTLDFYIIATVVSASQSDLTLDGVSTMKGQDAAIIRGYEQREDDQEVWLFAGSAAAYVKAPTAEALMSRGRPRRVTPDSVVAAVTSLQYMPPPIPPADIAAC
jgi:hypothetical protein